MSAVEDRPGSGGNSAQIPSTLVRMIDCLAPAAIEELHRALYLTLHPALTAGERREAEIGCLARLLRTNGEWPPAPPGGRQTKARRQGPLSPQERWPMISRELYDELRDEGAPESETLLRRHRTRSWPLICRMAGAYEIDGQVLNSGSPYPQYFRGREGPRGPHRAEYTKEDCWAAIEACEEAIGRRASVDIYERWSRAERRRARQVGAPDPRLPNADVIRRLLGRWPRTRRST